MHAMETNHRMKQRPLARRERDSMCAEFSFPES